MKKTLVFILTVILIFSSVSLGVSAAAKNITLGFEADKTAYVTGDSILFAVNVTNNTGKMKTAEIDVTPKEPYLFKYDYEFKAIGIDAESSRTVYYEMKIVEPQKANIIELIKRFIASVKFFFTRFDYKETIVVDGKKRTIGFDVTEISVTDISSLPGFDTEGDELPMTKAEVAEAYNEAVNALKAFKGNAEVYKKENTDISLAAAPSALISVLNSVLQSFAGARENEYVFENGEDIDGRTLDTVVMPFGRNADVKAEGLAVAKAYEGKDGAYTIKLIFAPEASLYDGVETVTKPVYNMGAVDSLNLEHLVLDPIVIEKAEMTYTGTTVFVNVDSEGKATALHFELPMEAAVEGKFAFISANVYLEGKMTTDLVVTYK